jgi:4-hydroxybenzoate polyprenyltransferase
MDFVPFLILLTLNKKLMDWLRVMIPDRWEAKVLIPLSCVVGVLLAFLFSASPELAAGIDIWSGHTLASASSALVVVYGLAIGTGSGVLHDAVKPHTPPHDGT